MTRATLLILMLGSVALAACVSGRPKEDVYVGRDGQQTIVEDAYQSCVRSCNKDYDRCGDSSSYQKSIDATQNMFGGRGMCSKSLSSCLSSCLQFK